MDNQKRFISIIEKNMEAGNYTEAYRLLCDWKERGEKDDILCLLEAEVCRQLGCYDQILPALCRGIAYNSNNYEIYYMMGDYYKENGNLQRAYLCYLHSTFVCNQTEDAALLLNFLASYKENFADVITDVALIISSVPSLEQMEAILRICFAFREDCQTVVVIDWEESKKVTDWLKVQKEIIVVSGKNTSSALIYQKTIDLLGENTDVLFLDQGAFLLKHSLFQLRMALYKNNEIGIVSSVTNTPVSVTMKLDDQIKQACLYADRHNVPGDEHVNQCLLPSCGTVLLRGGCWKLVSGFDDNYSTLEGMEKDYCFQLLKANKLIYLCDNALVYTFKQQEKLQACIQDYAYFYKKWNVHLNYSFFKRTDLLALLSDSRETPLKVLEVGCACGATLLDLKNRYPFSELHGIELDQGPWEIASLFFPVTQGNVETTLDYPEGFFDYILFGDVLEHLHQPEYVLENMKRHLKPKGAILASIPNVMHISVVSDLLNGLWTYQDSGILDRTHLRFFTRVEILRMFLRAGYNVEEIRMTEIPVNESQQKLIEHLCSLAKGFPEDFMAYQYLIKARINK